MGCETLAGLPLSINFAGTHLYTKVERGTTRVKCITQEHNTMFPAQNACSRVQHFNHEATMRLYSHLPNQAQLVCMGES